MRPVLVLLVALTACHSASHKAGTSGDAGGMGGDVADSAAQGDAADSAAGAAGAPNDAGESDLQKLERLIAEVTAAPDDATRQALVAAFYDDVAYGARGLPVDETGKLGFLYVGEATSVSVVGTLNAWDPSALPMTRPVADFPLWYAITDATEDPKLTRYRFLIDGTTAIADPWSRHIGWDTDSMYSRPETDPAQSSFDRWPRFDRGVGALAARDIYVYVPANVPANLTSALPVLYMNDGQNLFDPSSSFGGWKAGEAADAAIAGGEVQPFFIVALPNTPARIDEYTPVPDDLSSVGVVGGRGDEYVSFLVSGVKPFVDAHYPTRTDAGSTGILGSSIGGVASLYAGYLHPEVFGHAASMSGTLGWGSIGSANPTLMSLFRTQAAHTAVELYLDSGGGPGSGCLDTDSDGVHDDGVDATDNYCETVDMKTALEGLGWVDGVDLVYAWASGETHDEASWASRFPSALRSWFPRSTLP